MSQAASGGMTSDANTLKAPTLRKALARLASGVMSDSTTKHNADVEAGPPPSEAKSVESHVMRISKACQNHVLHL